MSTLESMTDEELALAYIDGNNRAFDELLSLMAITEHSTSYFPAVRTRSSATLCI